MPMLKLRILAILSAVADRPSAGIGVVDVKQRGVFYDFSDGSAWS